MNWDGLARVYDNGGRLSMPILHKELGAREGAHDMVWSLNSERTHGVDWWHWWMLLILYFAAHLFKLSTYMYQQTLLRYAIFFILLHPTPTSFLFLLLWLMLLLLLWPWMNFHDEIPWWIWSSYFCLVWGWGTLSLHPVCHLMSIEWASISFLASCTVDNLVESVRSLPT